jgi:hypothetical protein
MKVLMKLTICAILLSCIFTLRADNQENLTETTGSSNEQIYVEYKPLMYTTSAYVTPQYYYIPTSGFYFTNAAPTITYYVSSPTAKPVTTLYTFSSPAYRKNGSEEPTNQEPNMEDVKKELKELKTNIWKDENFNTAQLVNEGKVYDPKWLNTQILVARAAYLDEYVRVHSKESDDKGNLRGTVNNVKVETSKVDGAAAKTVTETNVSLANDSEATRRNESGINKLTISGNGNKVIAVENTNNGGPFKTGDIATKTFLNDSSKGEKDAIVNKRVENEAIPEAKGQVTDKKETVKPAAIDDKKSEKKEDKAKVEDVKVSQVQQAKRVDGVSADTLTAAKTTDAATETETKSDNKDVTKASADTVAETESNKSSDTDIEKEASSETNEVDSADASGTTEAVTTEKAAEVETEVEIPATS